MPAYNAAMFVRESINSVLSQTFGDFELIVVNDGSQDQTADILASIRDGRLRIIHNDRNLGVAESSNRAMQQARGSYIARIDSDDVCLPIRLDRQKRFLDSHPNILMVGSEMFNLEAGAIKHDPRRGEPDPLIIRWMFNVGNPVGHPSIMFRAEVVRTLGWYMRNEFRVCEDFDFSHRVLRIGEIATIPEQLGIYRRHPQSLTHTREKEVFDRVVTILRTFYADILGEDAEMAAQLVALHFMGGTPVRDAATLERLGSLLNRLMRKFFEDHEPTPQQKRRVVHHAAGLWWRTLQNSLRAGAAISVARSYGAFSAQAEARPPLRRLAGAALRGAIPRKHLIAMLRRVKPLALPAISREAAPKRAEINGVRVSRAAIRRDNPPILYVVVDCVDADIDAIRLQDEVQAILDKYGARPIYLVNEAVAGRPERCARLQRVFERGACAIGACDLPGGSSGGEQSLELYKQQLQHLSETIRQRFGAAPLFLDMALRDLRLQTVEALRRLGFAVVFGITGTAGSQYERGAGWQLPEATPYRVEPGNILLMPSINDDVGRRSRNSAGSDATRQISLMRTMIRRGYRTFTYRCRGPAPVGSGTPDSERLQERALTRPLDDLCRFFFEELGGLPGNPADLVPPERRHLLLPQPADTTADASRLVRHSCDLAAY